ncbi:SH3 domain-containing protein [Mycena pura]|uniref:SH3 domain-containing protein n=1 Tax=Mycena pura TaxID=153505 RepID=A0AAD6VRM9_9AGAR|nr:SH3 domain-containing protein [Mycena pura]
MDSRALLAHIVSQTRQNVEFLMSQNQISPVDGGEILAKLPRAPETPMAALEQRTQNLLISPPLSPGASQNYPQAPRLQQLAKAKALWGYNEGLSANGLSFRAGDIIEIIAETNADWWSGRCNGRQGLFPSNYVEKLAAATSPPNFSSPPMPAMFPSQPPYQAPSGPPPAGHYPAYPPGGGYQSAYQPPPGAPLMSGYSPYAPSPAAVGQPTHTGAVGPPPVPPKTSKFGQLGNTLAQSAAGGVGFGAGSAIGGDLVNSIF